MPGRTRAQLAAENAALRARITQLEQEVESLRQVEACLESHLREQAAVAELAGYGMGRCSVEGRVLDANPALAGLLGYASVPELKAASAAAMVCWDRGEFARLVADLAHADRAEGLEARWNRRDGTPLTVRVAARALRDEGGALVGLGIIAEEVTEGQLPGSGGRLHGRWPAGS